MRTGPTRQASETMRPAKSERECEQLYSKSQKQQSHSSPFLCLFWTSKTKWGPEDLAEVPGEDCRQPTQNTTLTRGLNVTILVRCFHFLTCHNKYTELTNSWTDNKKEGNRSISAMCIKRQDCVVRIRTETGLACNSDIKDYRQYHIVVLLE